MGQGLVLGPLLTAQGAGVTSRRWVACGVLGQSEPPALND